MDGIAKWKPIARGACLVAIVVTGASCVGFGGVYPSEKRAAMQCQENLYKLESATELWAIENDKKKGAKVPMSDLVGPTLYLRNAPRCPRGGRYPDVLTVGEVPTCDYVPPERFNAEVCSHKIPKTVE